MGFVSSAQYICKMNTLIYVALLFACIYGAPTENDIICAPGSESKLDCNTCVCSPDGTKLTCTKMRCSTTKYFNEDGTLKKPGEHLNNPLLRNKRNTQVCEPGKSFKNDCNTCRCSADGRIAMCTRRMCLKKREANPGAGILSKSSGPVYIQGTPCTPGTLFYSECNTCICDADGQSAGCTLKFCY